MHTLTINLRVLLMGLLMSSTLCLRAQAPNAPGPAQPSTPPPAAAQPRSASVSSSGWHARQGQYFQRNLGVDILGVQRVSSGEMLAFRYVILDCEKAKAFNDKRNSAYLIDEKSGAKLTVPQMEKVGALRTTTTPEAGRMYWIVFANTGRVVDTGSTVDVLIGDVRVDGLVVEAK
jgi:hypothetical protein